MKNTNDIQTVIPTVMEPQKKLNPDGFKLTHILMATILAPILLALLAFLVPSNHSMEGGSVYSGAVYNWNQSYSEILKKESDIKYEKCMSEKEGAAKKLQANAMDSTNNPATPEQVAAWVTKRDVTQCDSSFQ